VTNGNGYKAVVMPLALPAHKKPVPAPPPQSSMPATSAA